MKEVSKKILVSVVIPTYNSEKFITQLLDSLCRQTIDPKNFEVIVVDDCSTDNTIEVVKGYKKQIKQLVILSTENNTGNPIKGRNIGIDSARGEYIHFIDHDDYIGDEALERLYNAAQEWKSDVIFGKNVLINNCPGPVEIFKHGDIQNIDPHEHVSVISALAPHKMFRKGFLDENKIRFDPKIIFGEDQYFVMKVFANAKVISVKSDYDYYYRVARTDGNNLSKTSAIDRGPRKTFYRYGRIIQEINESKNDSSTKLQWKILYTQRSLKETSNDLALLKNSINPGYKDDKCNAIKEAILDIAGDEVLNNLSPQFALLVRLLADIKHRELIIDNILRPANDSVFVINNRIYIKTYDDEVYDASLYYKELSWRIKKINIIKNNMIITSDISFDEIMSDQSRISIHFESLETGYVSKIEGSSFKGQLRFILDVSGKELLDEPFILFLVISGDRSILRIPIKETDIDDIENNKLARSSDYRLSIHTLIDSRVVIKFNKRLGSLVRKCLGMS